MHEEGRSRSGFILEYIIRGTHMVLSHGDFCVMLNDDDH